VGLNYINYPTKVVFRSCKLIPTMLVALVVNKEIFSPSEILSAFAVCLGLVLFAFADMAGDSKVSTPFGLALQGGSVVADAFLPNLQQALFKKGGARSTPRVRSRAILIRCSTNPIPSACSQNMPCTVR
jgi:adenosine 3'-phospho 5'-phosphosulfate transporter B3